MFVYIQGVSSMDMKRFVVNFALGTQSGADITFHFNPCFEGWNKVIFNSKLSGQWSKEEEESRMPFKKGEHFELLVMVMMHISERQSLSFPLPAANVPHKTSLPEGIDVGKVMRIRGMIPNKAGRFYVNLLCGDDKASEAALHFNPRLDESTVVFNTLEQGKWGKEERGKGIPIQGGQPFEVLLITTPEGFKAIIGDEEYHHFRYRIPPARVRLLEVGGDVQLESVRIF
ncbi:galectin-7 [Sorex araneus]|uniref:galectin-7 n=1 Tax=Sorex araneus TaxID=42254 RepID=UPI00243385A5|nr:galectin-7 [Sorex araneus]